MKKTVKKVLSTFQVGARNFNIYRHSSGCAVVPKSVVTICVRKVGSSPFAGNLDRQMADIKRYGLVIHRDFFTLTKEMFVDMTSRNTTNTDTIVLSTKGIEKIAAAHKYNTCLKDLVRAMKAADQKMKPQEKQTTLNFDAPTGKSRIAGILGGNKAPYRGSITIEEPTIKEAVIEKQIEAATKNQVMLDAIMERVADKMAEKLLLRMGA